MLWLNQNNDVKKISQKIQFSPRVDLFQHKSAWLYVMRAQLTELTKNVQFFSPNIRTWKADKIRVNSFTDLFVSPCLY